MQRVQAIKPDFQLTKANARAIAEVCIRLDGLPLAIELAATRTRLLSPQALLARLSHRLDVLTGGARDLPDRQQTLRATIAWSYHLLSPQEQQIFRYLSVFVGGCTLEALEAITHLPGDGTNAVLDGVSMLLENHLAQQQEQADGEPRLFLLETIREYGQECLDSTEELEAARSAHAAYFLALAEQAEPHLRGKEQAYWLACLERERENLRAALSFLLELASTLADLAEGEHALEQALHFCIALTWFWRVSGTGREGLHSFMQALFGGASVEPALRARALNKAIDLAYLYARNITLEQLAEESLALYQELNDSVGIANSLFRLGSITRIRSQFALARARMEEAASRFQELGNRWRQGQCYTELASIATEQGQYEQAQALLSKSLTLYEALGDVQRLGFVRFLQAQLLFVWQQDFLQARQLAEQSLAHFQELGDTPYRIYTLGLLGLIHLELGELETARSLLEESLAMGKQLGMETDTVDIGLGLARLLVLQGDVTAARRLYQECLALLFEFHVYQEQIADGLEGLAELEAGQRASRQAVLLWGTAQTLRESIGAPMYPVYRPAYEQAVALARTHLGERAFLTAWAEGRSMTLEQALAAQDQATLSPSLLAKAATGTPPQATFRALAGLTLREVEVLHLLAQGWTDAQIAEHLVISPRTVNHHTASIYSKLGVSSRAAAARYDLEHPFL